MGGVLLDELEREGRLGRLPEVALPLPDEPGEARDVFSSRLVSRFIAWGRHP